MASVFEKLWTFGPAAFVLKMIVAAIVADALLLGFIMLRRTYRRRYFAKRDKRVYEIRQKWDALLSGEIPYDTWRLKSFDRQIVEEIVLDTFEASGPEESLRLLRFLRTTGLIEKRIFEARKYRGWHRIRALVALGRTRAPEGIPALAEGLRDPNSETRHAALRGLERIGSPEAAAEILAWVGEAGVRVSPLPLQNALINCCRESPRILLPYLQHADRPVREILARVLSEIPVRSLEPELVAMAEDELPELRAAAARALSNAEPVNALETLSELVKDPVWFVRLRAVVALKQIHDPRVIGPLMAALTDSNRLVRMRAAEGLVDCKSEMIEILARVVATQDRYGFHAYLAALENAGLRQMLETELQGRGVRNKREAADLLAVLRAGKLTEPKSVEAPADTVASATRP